MRQSKIFGKTKRTPPKEAELISHQYLVQGGFVDQLASGIYSWLPLGFKVYKKVEQIIREEMDAIGAQELYLPTLQPKKLWQETDRWKTIDPPLFKLFDRHNKEYGLGSTHEEVITDLARRNIFSYKDLPLAVYQIQNKFRNELRSTGGLLRVREFVMKDLYSFHIDSWDLDAYYEKVKDAYLKIFKRCGLTVTPVLASSGTIGGDISHEFALFSSQGEDKSGFCENCGFAANLEVLSGENKCPQCQSSLVIKNCIENGHIFKLGTKYSEAMKAYYKDKNGRSKPIIMGCYGIGLGRLVATVVEASHDKKGIIWPKNLTPFHFHFLLLSKKQEIKRKAEELYKRITDQNISILFDDRNESSGVKFFDADLIGIPYRLILSDNTFEKKSLEIKKRDEERKQLVNFNKIISFLKKVYA